MSAGCSGEVARPLRLSLGYEPDIAHHRHGPYQQVTDRSTVSRMPTGSWWLLTSLTDHARHPAIDQEAYGLDMDRISFTILLTTAGDLVTTAAGLLPDGPPALAGQIGRAALADLLPARRRPGLHLPRRDHLPRPRTCSPPANLNATVCCQLGHSTITLTADIYNQCPARNRPRCRRQHRRPAVLCPAPRCLRTRPPWPARRLGSLIVATLSGRLGRSRLAVQARATARLDGEAVCPLTVAFHALDCKFVGNPCCRPVIGGSRLRISSPGTGGSSWTGDARARYIRAAGAAGNGRERGAARRARGWGRRTRELVLQPGPAPGPQWAAPPGPPRLVPDPARGRAGAGAAAGT